MDYRSLKIEVSGLSGRVINLLRREGIETVGELMSRSPESLGKMKTCGKKALEEIMETIKRFEKMEQNEDSKDQELACEGSVDAVIGDYIEWTKSQEGNEYITTWLKDEQLKISSMDLLSARAYNYLLLNGYIYVHQIVFMTIEELMHIPRMDLHTAEEIVKACIYFLEEKENVFIDSYHNSRTNKKEQVTDVMMEMLYNCEYHDRILSYVIINDVILDKTECSNRMKNMLHKNDCYKLSDFIFMTEFELLNIPGMGNKTAEEIISFVKEYILEHENKLLAYCNGDDSILEESLEITALTLLRSKKYHDRFLQ